MRSLAHLAAHGLTAVPGGARILERAAGAHDPAAAPIFMLHRVLPEVAECYDPEMALSTTVFEAWLDWLLARYEVVELTALGGWWKRRARSAPRRSRPACVITFDDGWLDTFTYAFPLLRQRGVPATIFLPLHFVSTARRFWQERLYYHLRRLRTRRDGFEQLREVGASFSWCPELDAADMNFARLRRRLMGRSSPEAEGFVERLGVAAGISLELTGRAFINWDEARTMQRSGISFGSHTLNHTLVSRAAPAEMELELRASRLALGDQLGHPVTTFSYPQGGLSPFARAQVRAAGYECAVTTEPGLARAGGDPWLWPRVAISAARVGTDRRQFFPSLVQLQLARARAAATAAAPPGAEKRLRVGFVVDNPEAWSAECRGHLGGSELQLVHILGALDRRYFEPELYFLRPPSGGLPPQPRWPCFTAATGAAGARKELLGLYRLLRQRRPAVVQTMFVDGTFLGVPAAWAAGVPTILCARRNAGHWIRWYHRCALWVANRMADAWQTNASSVAALLSRDEGIAPAAIEILPNWLDVERLRPATATERLAARAQLGLPAAAFVAVCVANYTPVKNLPSLIAAAAEVCRRLSGAHFILVGEGPERPRLAAAIAAANLKERIQLAGSVADVAPFLAAADVGVHCSRSEGCSNAILEYMAAGLPVVVSDIPANRGLYAAMMFPPEEPGAAADAILALAADSAFRAVLGHRNRQYAEQFGGPAFAQRVQAHYLSVAGRCRRHRLVRGPIAAPPRPGATTAGRATDPTGRGNAA